MPDVKIAVTINGDRREADVWAGESLLNALRDDFGLPGSSRLRQARSTTSAARPHTAATH